MPSSENSICILGQSMVYSLMLMAGPPAGCAVVAQLDRALDSDSKGQRFESPRPHQKAAVLDGGLFLLLSRGAGQQKSPSPAPKRQSREGLSCFVGGFGGLTGRTRARAGAVNATRGTAEAKCLPKQRGGQLAPASAGYLSFAGQKLPRCDQKQQEHTFPFSPGWHRFSSPAGVLRQPAGSLCHHLRKAETYKY